MNATLNTNHGPIVLELFAELAPRTVENFKKLAESGYYNGTKFHRVISGFMIQGGDPLTKDDAMQGRWGTGGPGYTFEDEIHANNRNEIGTISMANAGPNTNGSQFFIITAASTPCLDGAHTGFGRVISGDDVVETLGRTPTGPGDRPRETQTVNTIRIEES